VRVIGGVLKGKRLCPIRGLKIRPTTDYLRESIFNILAGWVEDAVVLDLFAGTGSLGIEALSRGAATAVFVDKYPQSIKALTRNICACCLERRCTILKRDILESTSDGASIVIEHSRREVLPEKVARFILNDQRHYGKTLVSFYRSVL